MTRDKEIMQDFLNGKPMLALAKEHGISRVRIWQILAAQPEYNRYLQRKQLDLNNEKLIKSLRSYRKEQEIADRFWKNINKGSWEECWEWAGATHPINGYGRFTCTQFKRVYNLSTSDYTHRQMWCIWNGKPIPKGMWVLHLCDNPACVNPNHLYLGDAKKNVEDRQERSGWKDFDKKLSDKDIKVIKRIFKEEGMVCIPALADAFDVSTSYVYMLGKGYSPR